MLFILIVLSIPFYGLAIWGLVEPDEAILFLEKWRYKEEPVFSEGEMKLFKFRNIFAIVMMTFAIITFNYYTLVQFLL